MNKSKDMSLVVQLLDDFIEIKDVNPNKVYVSGLSMGGMGTFVILNLRPDMFAAATPICGDGDHSLVNNDETKVPV